MELLIPMRVLCVHMALMRWIVVCGEKRNGYFLAYHVCVATLQLPPPVGTIHSVTS